jgi:hypothetical protein
MLHLADSISAAQSTKAAPWALHRVADQAARALGSNRYDP